MPTEVIMPRLGWDMKVGSVAEWLKRDGDRVEVGETICMIAGDKATTELEAPESGILRLAERTPEVGEEVPIGTVLAYLLGPGEDAPAAVANDAPRGSVADTPSTRETGSSLANGAAETRAAKQGESAGRIVASPRARRAAQAKGIDWRSLIGSGRGGRILERDVPTAAEPALPSAQEPALPLQGIRRVTAERMALSAQTVAAVTLTTEADATALVRLREQAIAEQRDAGDELPTYSDLMIKVVALALGEHPALNAELTDNGIVQHAEANVAVAVDTPRGLIAPVVRDAAKRSVSEIAKDTKRLITAARAGTAQAKDLEGGTFTITNLGMFEIDAFTPMVNLPQCAILGLGRIIAKPVVVDEATEQVAVRRMLSLSLTFDHRLVDGAPAARFLQRIKHLVERPTLWLFR
jgi:pyruvate dehydrogenase E2 component (dihydrolipoamide acetyltransferase)